jgi:ribosomal protein L32
MSVRMRHTRSHTNNRRSHHAIKGMTIVKDAASGSDRLPHRIDESTGIYRGNLVGKPIVKKEKVKATREGTHHEHGPKEIHDHKHEEKSSTGIVGKVAEAARPRSRSGMGGGV